MHAYTIHNTHAITVRTWRSQMFWINTHTYDMCAADVRCGTGDAHRLCPVRTYHSEKYAFIVCVCVCVCADMGLTCPGDETCVCDADVLVAQAHRSLNHTYRMRMLI